jgi:hypothetical protein
MGTVVGVDEEVRLRRESRRVASDRLGRAGDCIEEAFSLVGSSSVESAIPYTTYIELFRAIENTIQGLRICKDITDIGSVDRVVSMDNLPIN